MRIKRAVQIKIEGKGRLYDLHSSCKIFKMTSEERNEKLLKILERMPKGTPSWVRSYLHGVQDALTDDLYKNHLEFCNEVDGKLYSVNRGSDRYYEKFVSPRELHEKGTKKGHYWKGTDKPFFVSPD